MNKQQIIDRLVEVFIGKTKCAAETDVDDYGGTVLWCYYRWPSDQPQGTAADCCPVGAFMTDEQVAGLNGENPPAWLLPPAIRESLPLNKDQATSLQTAHDRAGLTEPVLPLILKAVELWK